MGDQPVFPEDVKDVPRLAPLDVYGALGTAPGGLQESEVARRRARYGWNKLQRARRRSPLARFFLQFTDLFAVLLIVAAGITFTVYLLGRNPGDLHLSVAILGVVFLNALVGFIQEYRAERATEVLNKLVPAKARVYREGKELEIDAAELVPGDVILLEEGDNIPADARLVQVFELSTNNVNLTGEADPQRKTAAAVLEEELGWIELPNLVFMGTFIASGSGIAVVVATGAETQFGKIFTLTAGVPDVPSPLQKEVRNMARVVARAALVIGGVIFGLGRFLGLGWIEDFLFAMGVMVAMVPEGLPATMSVSLAVGVQRMARRNALIKRLSAVETLGSADVICTDKTGTLTKGEMTVREIWRPGERVAVTGVGYEPRGELKLVAAESEPAESPGEGGTPQGRAEIKKWELFLKAASFCNTARLLPPEPEHPAWSILGDPTEGALLVLAQKAGFDWGEALKGEPRHYLLPFDSRRKRMSSLHRRGEQVVAYVKGAPRETLTLCTRIVGSQGEVFPLDDAARAAILRENDEMARRGLRVLAFACRELPGEMREYREEEVERDLAFLGFAGMLDPPRPEVTAAVKTAKEAGIRILMLTGDYGLTAEAIASRITITGGERVPILTGAELVGMDADQLMARLEAPSPLIFARVAPEHKMRVVAALQELGQVVAVTGDGVNDGPALKRADIGIAMGRTGTDVAREAAVMILLDDSFASIVKAIELGRAVYANIRKFILYLFSHNMGELLPFLFATVAGVHLIPLTALQVLAIDLGSDVLPALALGIEKPEPGLMRQPPRPRTARLFDFQLVKRLLFLGGIQGAGAIAGFLFVLLSGGWQWGTPLPAGDPLYRHAITMTHAAIVVSQVFNSFAVRTETISIFQTGFFTNPFLLLGQAVGVGIMMAISYLPFLQRLFNTAPLRLLDWCLLLAFGVVLLAAEEARKYLVRRRMRG
ncbi:MAG: cation-transporting P-type ATPase [Bacillota bacterium]|nr:cation-transporting P-type ATPase [Bacillota bacterium]